MDGCGSEAISCNVRVLTHERNLGIGEARNTISTRAKGDVIVFFDADAVPRPDCLEKILRHYRDEEVCGVGGRGVESGLSNGYQKWRARTTPQDHGTCPIRNDWMIMGLCSSFRKKAIEFVGGFDSSFSLAGEDVDICLRLRQSGQLLVYEPDAVVDHIPGGGLYAVTMQAYKHAKYATYAFGKNRESHLGYVVDTYRHLGRTSIGDLRQGNISDSMTGLINLAARTAGFVLGSVKAKKALMIGPRF